MEIQGMKISIINIILTLAVCLSLISCSKGGGMRSAEESLVLETSTFNPSEKAPGVELDPQSSNSILEESQNSNLASISIFQSTGGHSDGGSIPRPGGGQGGSDSGTIPPPGSATVPVVIPSPVTTPIPDPVSPGTGAISNPAPSTNPLPSPIVGVPVENPPVSSGGNNDTPVIAPPVASGGGDSGTIGNSGPVSGNDNGAVPGGSGSSIGDSSGTPVVDNGNPNSTPIHEIPSANIPVTTPIADNGTPNSTPIHEVPPSNIPVTTPIADNGTPISTPIHEVPPANIPVTPPIADNGTPISTPIHEVPPSNIPVTPPIADNGNPISTPIHEVPPANIPVTPPIADNGNPISTPIHEVPPSNIPVTPPIADNGNPTIPEPISIPLPPGEDSEQDEHGATGGHSCSCQTPAPVGHSSCHSRKRGMTINLGRVCSRRRSASNSLFFEEAKNPILAVEAIVTKSPMKYGRRSSNPYSSSSTVPQWGVLSGNNQLKNRVLVASYDLRGVSLYQSKYSQKVFYNLGALKKELGGNWRRAAIVVSVCDDRNGDGSCYGEEVSSYLSVVPATFRANRLPKQISLDIWNGRGLSQTTDVGSCDKQYSPIVLDLTGQGIQLSGPEDGTQFDLNNDGNKVYTGWVKGANNAFLVQDLSGNGRIDNGGELFGSATLLANGKRAANGFEALKDLDSNRDGLLNNRDSKWKNLSLWFDRNYDAYTQYSELENLNRYQIQSINLNYIELLEMDEFGNQTRERSTYVRKIKGKNTPLMLVDIWFRTFSSE